MRTQWRKTVRYRPTWTYRRTNVEEHKLRSKPTNRNKSVILGWQIFDKMDLSSSWPAAHHS